MEHDPDITKTVFLKSMANLMMTTILEDPDMTYEFVVQPSEDKQESLQQKPSLKIIEEEAPRQSIEKEETKCNISRLEIQIVKNGFLMSPICGEVFFLLIDAFLEGKKSQEKGKLMMTNYRVLFFKDKQKRVDLPFGHIAKVEYIDRQFRIVYTLKYPHFWKFTIAAPSKYFQFKNVGDIYYKSEDIKRMFAFEYALKIMPPPEPYYFSLVEEYRRLKFDSFAEVGITIQQNYNLSLSYPPEIYTLKNRNVNLGTIASHRKNKRFPILAYKYLVAHSKTQIPLWISSSYEDIKAINKSAEKQLLLGLKCGQMLEAFVAESKNVKTIDQQQFDKQIGVTYLKLESNEQLRVAERHIFEVFLANKKPFIKEVLASKWYNYIANLLHSCQLLRNAYLREISILIRCQTGMDKSLLLASLLQIIMDPFFRTFKGFELLVMRMFVHYGHPFAERLGLRTSSSSSSPIFLQFLDCVAQLLYQNPSSFEFNSKYLAKIANLMPLNIYGTFLANCSREYRENRVQVQTCSIWGYLVTPITTNGFYDKKGGVLELSCTLSSIRIWKQHFGNTVSRNKDHYGFEEIAEDNDDYLNLYCLRLKEENQQLMTCMALRKAELEMLQKQLRDQQACK